MEAAQPLTVAIAVDPLLAGIRGAQLAIAMLCNILARSVGSVTNVILSCRDVPLAEGVMWGAQPGVDLGHALVSSCDAIGGVELTRGDDDNRDNGAQHLVIGIGDVKADLTMTFGNWWGGLSTDAAAALPHDPGRVVVPFGAFAAAAHAGAEVFRRSRVPTAAPLVSYVHDLWNQRVITDRNDLPSDDWLPDAVQVDGALAGVGAVGNAWIATMWATPGLTGTVLYADADLVDDTNLNRCILFNLACIGRLKSQAVEPLLANALNELTWSGSDTVLQAADALTFPVPLLISAVDTNRARRDLQSLNPQRALAASTHNLRVDLLRPGAPGEGACLLCYNPIEPEVSDRELRRRWLTASPAEREHLATDVGESVEVLDRWARQARCGELDARALPVLAEALGAGPRQFSVGYLSVLAGVMLAAETVKEAAGVAAGLVGVHNRAVVQTVTPWSSRNRSGRLAADSNCSVCSDGRRASMWARRYLPRVGMVNAEPARLT